MQAPTVPARPSTHGERAFRILRLSFVSRLAYRAAATFIPPQTNTPSSVRGLMCRYNNKFP